MLRKDTPIVPMRNLFSKSPGSEFCEHNEIIFTPKPGVNIHPGMPATEDIDVIGAFRITPNEDPPMASALNRGYNLNILSLEEEAGKFLDTFKINNSSLPVINIRGKGGWR
ncbi:hypothetical protein OQ483_23890 (plasmid) [Enterobacter bugandensis]|uniref:hypothetical protein n=1 Tax=Enterobacter bugandensis TaxID=881260 RepID=UPI00283A9D29|nr:hypothetical protein [Enterobacter bugandensis]WMU75432.1 hypothetical protein OQ483_23890 [Enterobacter bugandensis]